MIYTVMGYWEDTNEPWVCFGEGVGPEAAVQDACTDLEDVTGLVIVDVFEGRHVGLLGYKLCVYADDLI